MIFIEFLSKYENRLHAIVVEEHGIGFKVIADLRTLLPNTLILGSRRTRSKMEVFQSCSQFVEQGHIFLEKAERDFHYLIFDEFEKIHTETEFTDDIADVLSEFIMWFPEKNRLGIPCPDDMYNHKVLKNDAVSVRAKAPFSCLSVCDT